MSTPSPLIPQGTFQAQAARGASSVRVVVATIVAIHVVFFGGVLLQGCKRDTKLAENPAETNEAAATPMSLPQIDTNLYYPAPEALPTESGTGLAAPAGTSAVPASAFTPSTQTQELWQSSNIPAETSSMQPAAQDSGSAQMIEYTVVRGDSFSRIAVQNHTTVSAIRKANPNVDPLRIQPGQKLNVPVGTPAAAQSGGGAGESSSVGGANIYTVKAGDNLTKIGRAYGVTVSQLRAANKLRTGHLKVGQKLKIPPSAQAQNGTTNGSPRQ